MKLIEAAKANGISRYLIVSAIGVTKPDSWSDDMKPYYEAKAAADRDVEASGLEYTIVRPGGLTDDSGTGKVDIAEDIGRSGSVAREDVALVIAECLTADNAIGKAFDLLGGETPVAEAIAAL